jgi:hypothetical protein
MKKYQNTISQTTSLPGRKHVDHDLTFQALSDTVEDLI